MNKRQNRALFPGTMVIEMLICKVVKPLVSTNESLVSVSTKTSLNDWSCYRKLSMAADKYVAYGCHPGKWLSTRFVWAVFPADRLLLVICAPVVGSSAAREAAGSKVVSELISPSSDHRLLGSRQPQQPGGGPP